MNYRTERFIQCRQEAFSNPSLMPIDCLDILKKHYGIALPNMKARTIRNMMDRLMRTQSDYDNYEEIRVIVEEWKSCVCTRKTKLYNTTFERLKAEALNQYGMMDYKTCMKMIIETYAGHIHNMKVETLVDMIYEMLAIKYSHLLTCEIVDHVKQCLKELDEKSKEA